MRGNNKLKLINLYQEIFSDTEMYKFISIHWKITKLVMLISDTHAAGKEQQS